MLFIIAGVIGLGLTSCVKNEESASVTELRNAKAAQLTSIAALNNAKAEAILIDANANKALSEAKAAYELAQAAYQAVLAEGKDIENQKAELELQKAELDLQKAQATLEMEIQKLMLEAQTALAKAQARFETAKAELIAALDDVADAERKRITDLIADADEVFLALQTAQEDLVDAQTDLLNAQYDLIDFEEEKEKTILEKEAEIANWQAMIDALTELGNEEYENVVAEQKEVGEILNKLNQDITSALQNIYYGISNEANNIYNSLYNIVGEYWDDGLGNQYYRFDYIDGINYPYFLMYGYYSVLDYEKNDFYANRAFGQWSYYYENPRYEYRVRQDIDFYSILSYKYMDPREYEFVNDRGSTIKGDVYRYVFEYNDIYRYYTGYTLYEVDEDALAEMIEEQERIVAIKKVPYDAAKKAFDEAMDATKDPYKPYLTALADAEKAWEEAETEAEKVAADQAIKDAKANIKIYEDGVLGTFNAVAEVYEMEVLKLEEIQKVQALICSEDLTKAIADYEEKLDELTEATEEWAKINDDYAFYVEYSRCLESLIDNGFVSDINVEIDELQDLIENAQKVIDDMKDITTQEQLIARLTAQITKLEAQIEVLQAQYDALIAEIQTVIEDAE